MPARARRPGQCRTEIRAQAIELDVIPPSPVPALRDEEPVVAGPGLEVVLVEILHNVALVLRGAVRHGCAAPICDSKVAGSKRPDSRRPQSGAKRNLCADRLDRVSASPLRMHAAAGATFPGRQPRPDSAGRARRANLDVPPSPVAPLGPAAVPAGGAGRARQQRQTDATASPRQTAAASRFGATAPHGGSGGGLGGGNAAVVLTSPLGFDAAALASDDPAAGSAGGLTNEVGMKRSHTAGALKPPLSVPGRRPNADIAAAPNGQPAPDHFPPPKAAWGPEPGAAEGGAEGDAGGAAAVGAIKLEELERLQVRDATRVVSGRVALCCGAAGRANAGA